MTGDCGVKLAAAQTRVPSPASELQPPGAAAERPAGGAALRGAASGAGAGAAAPLQRPGSAAAAPRPQTGEEEAQSSQKEALRSRPSPPTQDAVGRLSWSEHAVTWFQPDAVFEGAS